MYVFGALAAAQGFFLCGLLWLHGGERGANRWLAAALAAFSLVTVSDALLRSGAIDRVPHLAYVFDWLIFLIGPFVYRYVVCLTDGAPLTKRAAVLHALPALLLLLMLTPFLLSSGDEKLKMVHSDLQAPPRLDPLLLLAAAQVLSYWIASVLQLRRFRVLLTQHYSNLDALKSAWLSWLLAANLLLWAAWLVTLLAGRRSEWIETLATPLAIYGLGYVGLRTPRVFRAPNEVQPTSEVVLERPAAQDASAERPKYTKSALDPAQLAALQNRLTQFVDLEKPFLEDELTLDQLANRLLIPAHQLSQVFSLGLKQSFYDYINGQRVAEVQRCLRDAAYDSQSILDIALSSGFSSKATFNAVFKKHTGMTPSTFRAGRAPTSNPPG